VKFLHASVYLFCLVALLIWQSNTAQADGNCATPIPAGFDWPADPVHLYQISGGLNASGQTIPGKIDTKAQRDHAWALFAGITQPSSPQPGALPIFHTWYTVEETFDPTDGKIDCASRRILLRVSLPTQLLIEHNTLLRSDLRKEGINLSPRFDVNPALVSTPANYSALDTAGDNSIIAFSHVAFNQEMYDFIRDNKYYKRSTLDQLIDTSIALKPIVDPPLKGISLKFSWWPVAPTGLTLVPVWDFNQRFPGDAKNPPDTWPRVVVVDPIGGQTPPTSVTLNGYVHSNPSAVSLDKFYAVKVSAEEATLANADFRISAATKEVLGRPLQAGDYLVMTAMHIATREFDPWVFTTFWWSGR
jgi:hypothetical protein